MALSPSPGSPRPSIKVVETLFDLINSFLIQVENQNERVEYVPRNFDEMNWGMTKKQILEIEGKPTHFGKSGKLETMTYFQKVINLDCAIDYIFASNRLS